MENIAKVLISLITGDGPTSAVIAVLLLVIGFLVWERIQMSKQLNATIKQTLEAKDSEKQIILDIVEKYHQGNLTMVQAINELKVVLAAIQGRLL